jgi:hydroxypyruvate reductase
VPDAVGVADALAMIEGRGITLPDRVMAHLRGPDAAAPHPEDPVFQTHQVRVIASARLSLEAAAAASKAQGIPAVILSDAIEGEARDVGQVHAAIAREVAARGRPFTAPVVVLSGGETTVTLRGTGGRGGRNSEFLLSAAIALDGIAGVSAMAADTDGIDGSEDNAGAFADGETVLRMRDAGLDPAAALARNDAWGAFAAVHDLFVPGPTGTNVNDFRAFLVRPATSAG